ncbi:MAG: hypothetical protein JW983_00365 [Elusimicrobia bacterium]|nr:hypothetical protein [Elusimicrobiota bacterium]
MATVGNRPAGTVRIRQLVGLKHKIKLANLISVSDAEFNRFINELENDPLFKCFRYDKKIISRRRFFASDLSSSFYELKEAVTKDETPVDVESVIEQKKEVVELIKKLGIDKFKKYFLYNDDILSPEEIACECGLPVSDVIKISGLINKIAVRTELSGQTGTSGQKHYSNVASIEDNSSGDFIIGYLSPNLARGKYIIDYKSLGIMKKDGIIPEKDMPKLKRLIENLELVNSRMTTLYQVLHSIIKLQCDYLKSGDITDMKPLTEKEVAKRININPSLICRAIANRSVNTPWKEEKPIREFFSTKKQLQKIFVREIIADERQPCSDENLKIKLYKKYNINISRRSINVYRREMKIASSRQRKKN